MRAPAPRAGSRPGPGPGVRLDSRPEQRVGRSRSSIGSLVPRARRIRRPARTSPTRTSPTRTSPTRTSPTRTSPTPGTASSSMPQPSWLPACSRPAHLRTRSSLPAPAPLSPSRSAPLRSASCRSVGSPPFRSASSRSESATASERVAGPSAAPARAPEPYPGTAAPTGRRPGALARAPAVRTRAPAVRTRTRTAGRSRPRASGGPAVAGTGRTMPGQVTGRWAATARTMPAPPLPGWSMAVAARTGGKPRVRSPARYRPPVPPVAGGSRRAGQRPAGQPPLPLPVLPGPAVAGPGRYRGANPARPRRLLMQIPGSPRPAHRPSIALAA